MDLSKLNKKTANVPRGFTYTYYTSPAKNSKPTLFLLHGWPDNARIWAGFINDYLLPQGYGIIALDDLGYGDSSRPTDEKAYACDELAADYIAILDAEGIDKVIAIGHDWGSLLAQRLYNFYPARIRGLVMVTVTYVPPSGSFHLNELNELTKKIFGYPVYEYWFFMASEEAAGIMNSNLESVYTAAFADVKTWYETTFWAPGGLRRFISEGRTLPTLPFATPDHKTDFIECYSRDGGFAGACCLFRSLVGSIFTGPEKKLPEEAKTVNVPVLYWGGAQDLASRPEMTQPSIDQGLLPDFKSIIRDGGHWACLEHPDEFGQDVMGWLQERFE
ncbi:alpha/beta-hydrolase [Colletotrichum zoysiae]|uniref:Alpha/beta-hydrolase n=1 Tax=Colletotrichum zoysiae TaxID=1216348 RepID=A0AAD9HND5_9PEZI|nr:alpha/beta-hydrolase [Colletotrichum zoysiae]